MHYRNILYEKVTYMPILIWDVHKNQVRQLSQTQQQHNKTQPQHSCWVGHENDLANPITHPPQKLNSSLCEHQNNIL